MDLVNAWPGFATPHPCRIEVCSRHRIDHQEMVTNVAVVELGLFDQLMPAN